MKNSSSISTPVKSRKTPKKTAKSDTPLTDDFVQQSQTQAIPFHVSFYQLLELARGFERQITLLKNQQKRLAHKAAQSCMTQDTLKKKQKIQTTR